jgi:two-component system response regulator PilR (NtrC family)
MAALEGYAFPGNVRELENILERAYTLCEDDCIEVGDLHFSPAARADAPSKPATEDSPAAPSHSAHPAECAPEPEDEELALATDDEPADPLETGSLEDYLESIERRKITEALEATRWNKTAAAKKLGITFRALRYRLKKLGME